MSPAGSIRLVGWVGDVVLHLLGIDIENFRSLEDQWVPADGLVVLFGPNSAGKTSVLEAVDDLISQTGALRADPGADDDPLVIGSVIFGLPAADVAGSEDSQLYASLLRGEYIKPGVFGIPRIHGRGVGKSFVSASRMPIWIRLSRCYLGP